MRNQVTSVSSQVAVCFTLTGKVQLRIIYCTMYRLGNIIFCKITIPYRSDLKGSVDAEVKMSHEDFKSGECRPVEPGD